MSCPLERSVLQLGVPGDGASTEEEDVRQRAPHGVQTVRMRRALRIVVAVDTQLCSGGGGSTAEIVFEALIGRALEVSQQALERDEMLAPRVVQYVLAQLAHRKRQI